MTDTRQGSTYPPAVQELLPRARAVAARLGELPSRNRLMRELRVGAAKASAVLAELADGEPAAASTAATVTVTRPATAQAPVRAWPVMVLALPAFVAIWSGWVGLGGLTGFGVVHPLPGIWDGLEVNTAITLPIGMETYAAYALRAWLSPSVPVRARRFALWSAIGALTLGAAGQVAYHLMSAASVTAAPWQVTTVVACLPVAVLGIGAALTHLLSEHDEPPVSGSGSAGEASR